jgi:hypothetical protein
MNIEIEEAKVRLNELRDNNNKRSKIKLVSIDSSAKDRIDSALMNFNSEGLPLLQKEYKSMDKSKIYASIIGSQASYDHNHLMISVNNHNEGVSNE